MRSCACRRPRCGPCRARPAASRAPRARPGGGSRARPGRGPRRRRAAGSGRRAVLRQEASARSAAASACSRSSVSRPGLDGDGDPLGLLRLALDRVDHPVADPADLGLQRAEQLAGADELLPARQHLAAQQGAVGGGLVDRGHGVGRTPCRRPRAGGVRRRPARSAASATGCVRRASVRIAPSRVCWTTAARASASAASELEPAAGSRHRRRRAAARRRRPSPSVTMNSGESLRPRLAQHPGEVGGDRVDGLGRGAVEHDRDRGGALGGLRRKSHGTWSAYRAAEVTKSHRSAAASSWAARVRLRSSTESMSGASRIARPGGTARRRHELERGGVGGAAVDPLEVGQHPVLAEPLARRRGGGPAPASGSSAGARRAR